MRNGARTMARIHSPKDNELTRVLAERLEKIWDAYLQVDEEAHSEMLAEDYRAVHPDGTVRIGKPSAKEIAAAPIEDYWLRELEAWPVGGRRGDRDVHGGSGSTKRTVRPTNAIRGGRSLDEARWRMEVPVLPWDDADRVSRGHMGVSQSRKLRSRLCSTAVRRGAVKMY